jgi:hypothetical protein
MKCFVILFLPSRYINIIYSIQDAYGIRIKAMVFKATFNNISIRISRRSVLLVEETGVPGENHRPLASD